MRYQELDVKRYLRSVATLSAEKVVELREWCHQADSINSQHYNAALEWRRQMLKYAAQIWPRDSREYKAIARHEVPAPPNSTALYIKVRRKWLQHQEAEQARARRRQYAQERKARAKEAARKLGAMGLIEGQDFTLSNAISTLKQLEAMTEAH